MKRKFKEWSNPSLLNKNFEGGYIPGYSHSYGDRPDNNDKAPKAHKEGKEQFLAEIADDTNGGAYRSFIKKSDTEYEYKSRTKGVSAVLIDNGNTFTLKGTTNKNQSYIFTFDANDSRNTIYEAEPELDDKEDLGTHLVVALDGNMVDINLDNGIKKPLKESKKMNINKKLKESLLDTFVVANNDDGTIIGLFKDEEKARLKAGSYNALTNSEKFVSCPFIEIRNQNYKFSKDLLDKICDKLSESKKLKESEPEVVECKIYSYYAPYFLDGEVSGFTDDELDDCHALEEAIREYTGCTECVDVKDDADFGDVRIPVGIRCKGFKGRKFLPGSVSTFVFQKNKKKALTEASKYDKKYDHYFPGLSRSANEDGTYKFSTEGLKDDNRSYFGGRSYTTGESPIVDKHNKAFSDEINKWANENYDNWIDSDISSRDLNNKINKSEGELRSKFWDTDEYKDLNKKRSDARRYRDISRTKGWANTEKKQDKIISELGNQIDQLEKKYIADNEDKDLRKSHDDINAVYDKYRNDYWNIRKTHSDALDQELKDRRDAVEKKVVGKDFYSGYPKGTNHETPRFGAMNGDYDDKLSFYYANGEKDGQKMYKRVGRNNHTSTPWGPNRGLVDYYASADPYEDFEDVPESDIENLNKLDNWDSMVAVGGRDSTD